MNPVFVYNVFTYNVFIDKFVVYLNLFADFGRVATRQHVQVRFQGATFDDSVVSGLVVRFAKQDIVAQAAVLNPSLLRHQGEAAVGVDAAAQLLHLAEQCGDERRFAGADLADDGHQLSRLDGQIDVLQYGRFVGCPSKRRLFDDNRFSWKSLTQFICRL